MAGFIHIPLIAVSGIEILIAYILSVPKLLTALISSIIESGDYTANDEKCYERCDFYPIYHYIPLLPSLAGYKLRVTCSSAQR